MKSWADAGWPRRVEVASDGSIFFGEYFTGKIARFDPKTETFKEYQLPGPQPSPYALGIDKDDKVWYSSYYTDVVGCLDPKTGKVIEYPIRAGEFAREFFIDAQAAYGMAALK
jgi:virginiamycin B lyase